MKLELKHILPYLPYNLKALSVFQGVNLIRPIDLLSASSLLDADAGKKIMLLPISCLTEEIEHNGERFMPAIEIAKLVDNGHSHSVSSVISSTGSNYIKIRTGAVDDVEDVQISFSGGKIQSVERSGVKVMYQTVVRIQDRLASMHIDFQGLIPAGLAVDKREVTS